MTKRLLVVVLSYFFATTASALTVNFMYPTAGTVGGGDVIKIYVEQVPICDPFACQVSVRFGDTPAPAIETDITVLYVTTPPHPHGTVDVTVSFGGTTAPAGKFTFRDLNSLPETTNYEMVLVPIPVASDAIPGAFGSRWTSELWVYNRSSSRAELFNGRPFCMLANPIGCSDLPFPGIGSNLGASITTPANGEQAFIYYLQRGHSRDVSFSLRVRDVSRTLENAGTEIPVGREATFSDQRLELLNVPIEAASRTSLRVYSLDGLPSYTAEVRLFTMDGTLVTQKTIAVKTVSPETPFGVVFLTSAGVGFIANLASELGTPPPANYRIEVIPNGFKAWALATVTNNTTQLVTAIAP